MITRIGVVAVALGVLVTACDGPEQQTTDGEPDGALEVTGTNSLSFEPDRLSTRAGTITVELTAEPAVRHTFVVEDANGDQLVVEADAGMTATGTIDLTAGGYVFYCDVPGHREAGMEGTFRVTE